MKGLAFVIAALVAAPQAGLPPSLARIERYAHSSGPYHDVTVRADEVNSYLNSSSGRLPRGVSQVSLGSSSPDVVFGSALVDFDQLSQGGSSSPLLQLFSGQHRVAVRAHVDSASAPDAHLTVTEVRLDDAVIPNWLVDAAIRAFLQPRHPNLGLSFTLPLPTHATSVMLATNSLTVHYF